MELKQIHHVALICSDYATSKSFYVDKLGFKLIRENYRKERNDWKIDLQCGEIELELFVEHDPPERLSGPEACGLRHLAFRVDNIEDVIKELEEKQIFCEPIRRDTFTGEKMTFFRDPDGLPIELHE